MEKRPEQLTNQPKLKEPEIIEDYEVIDPGIHELIQKLNNLPYILTSSSCEGHLRNDLGPSAYSKERPENGHSFIFDGHIIFFADKTNPNAHDLLGKINQLVDKYPFASIHEHYCDEEDCKINGAQCLNLDYSDLTHADTITDEDSLAIMHKKRFQVLTEIGQKRVEEYHQFWSDLDNVITELSDTPSTENK